MDHLGPTFKVPGTFCLMLDKKNVHNYIFKIKKKKKKKKKDPIIKRNK